LQLSTDPSALVEDVLADVLSHAGLNTLFTDMEAISISPEQPFNPPDSRDDLSMPKTSNIEEPSSWTAQALNIVQGLQQPPSTSNTSEFTHAAKRKQVKQMLN
jgi:hypothetical protein